MFVIHYLYVIHVLSYIICTSYIFCHTFFVPTFLQDRDKMKFKGAKREFEFKIGRFKDLRQGQGGATSRTYPVPGWVAETANRDWLDKLLESGNLKVPKSWPALRAIFADCKRLKIAETFSIAGDVGRYILQFLEIDHYIRDLFIESFGILAQMRCKMPIPRHEFKDLQRQLDKVTIAAPRTFVVHHVHILYSRTYIVLR